MAYFKETRVHTYEESIEMSAEEKKKYLDEVRNEITQNPPKHLENEWGTFEGIKGLSDEQIDKKAKELLDKMTLEQKVNQMSGDASLDAIVLDLAVRYNEIPYYAGEDFELEIPPIKFSDGPTGVVMYNSTAFPVSMGRAASFDKKLENAIGDAIGTEIRAQGGNYYGGVCINLVRHPSWGRAQESYGEDPTVLGYMGSALSTGVQKHVMACIKHFAANSIENTRFSVDVDMDERTLREIYLPHFKRCIDSGAASVMSAYNIFRGEHCGHSEYLLKKILKDEWGFKGFVLSDFVFGIIDTVDPANHGMDVEMPTTIHYGTKLLKAVNDHKVSEDAINDSVLRILRQKIRFSQIGNKSYYTKDKVVCKEHTELARKAAEESFVLLKNDNNILPLNIKNPGKIAVIGKLASISNIGDGKGSSAVRPPYVVTMLDGIKNKLNAKDITYYDGTNADEAAEIASEADKVIFVTGLTCADEGEYMSEFVDLDNPNSVAGAGGDRESLRLHDNDIKMIDACCAKNKNVIVCVMGGSAVIMDPWNNDAAAIMMVWYPGMEGGNALANVLFGDVNPSGKLPLTIPKDETQLPEFALNQDKAVYDYYHGYFLADKKDFNVRYHFGFGLSYTNYTYSNLKVSKTEVLKNDTIEVLVDVTNTGKVAGDEIVQMYVGYNNPSVERHIKDLKNFTRVSLQPNETKTVVMELSVSELAYYSLEKKDWTVDEISYNIMVGSSSNSKDLLVTQISVK